MKRLLTILFLFTAFLTKGQVTYNGLATQGLIQRGAAGALVTIIIPQDTDITAFPTLPKNGRIAVKYGKFYNYDTTQGKWVKPAGSGGGGGTTYYPGYAIQIDDDSIKVDTSVLSGYFVRDKDSTIQFATPAQLATGLATKANTSHTHIVSDITDLQNILNGKLDSLTVSNDTFYTWKNGVRSFLYYNDHYTKTAADAKFELLANKKTNLTSPDNTGFPTTQAVVNGLAGKSDIGHTHTISDVTGLSDSLRKKADTTVTNNLNTWVQAKPNAYDTVVFFSNNFNTGSVGTGFTDVSNNSSYAGGKLTWTVDQNLYINYIKWDQVDLSENYYMSMSFKYDASTDHARGLAVGLRSVNPYGYTHTVISGFDADSNKLYFRNSSTKFYGSSFSPIAVGDSLKLTQRVIALHYYIELINYTQGWTATYDQQLTPSGVPFSAHNAGNPAIYHVGGDYSVYNWTYAVIKPHDLDLVVLGNSITEGQAATSQDTRYAALIKHQNHIYIAGGGADASYQVLQRLAGIIRINPKAVTINEGNDILFGTADSAWQANLRIIRDSLANNGIATIWLSPTPRNSTDMRGMKYWIDTFTAFRSDLKIDLYSPLRDSNTTYGLKSVYDSGDGLHPNDWGHRTMADLINVGLENGTNYSGDVGYLPVFTVNNSLKNSKVYQNSSNNVGINTTSPQYQLDVNGIGYFRGVLFSTTSVQTLGNMLALPALTSNEAISWGSQAAGSVAVSAAYGVGALNLGGVAKGKAKNMLDVYGGAVFGQALAVDSTAPTNGIAVQGAIKNDAGNYSSGGYKVVVENNATHLYENVTANLNGFYDTTVTGDWTFSIPAGKILSYVVLYADNVDNVDIGTTSGGSQILPSTALAVHQPTTISVGEAFDLSNSTNIYFTGATGSIRYIIHYE